MGRVHRVQVIVDIEADAEPGVLTRYEVIGQTGSIYEKRPHIEIRPVYGNPGEEATQVFVNIDAMLIPVGNEQLVKIIEESLQSELPATERSTSAPIVLRELGAGA